MEFYVTFKTGPIEKKKFDLKLITLHLLLSNPFLGSTNFHLTDEKGKSSS